MLAKYVASVFIGISLVGAKNYDVAVGENGANTFVPDHVSDAVVGDTVTFQFSSFHSAVESTLANPCVRKEGGFDSGQVTSGSFQITINSTEPTWVYCDVGNHCRVGMVFAVNPGNNLATFQAVAQGQAPPTSSGSGTTDTHGSVTGSHTGSHTGQASATSTGATTTSTPGAGFANVERIGAAWSAAGLLGLTAMLF